MGLIGVLGWDQPFDAYNLPVAWTNVRLVAVASTDHALLQFGFRDDPDYLDFDDVSVVLIPSPEFLPGGLTVTNGNLALTWREVRPGYLPASVYHEPAGHRMD